MMISSVSVKCFQRDLAVIGPAIVQVWLFYTAKKMKYSIKDFFSKCDQIHRKLRICSHLPKKSLMENFFCFAVLVTVNLECFSKSQEMPLLHVMVVLIELMYPDL